MKIKVCGLKYQKNLAELVKTVNVDYIGFIFVKESPRYASRTLTPESVINLESMPSKTGVFADSPIETVLNTSKLYRLSTIQLHGKESPSFCEKIKHSHLKVIKSFNLFREFDFNVLNAYTGSCDYFLFDTKGLTKGGTGKKFDWKLLQDYHFHKPFFLSGGIGTEDAQKIIEFIHPWLYGVDINSRFEDKPGSKNIEQIKRFVNQINSNKYEKD